MQPETEGETAGVWAEGDVETRCQLRHFDDAISSEATHDDGVVLARLRQAWKRKKCDENSFIGLGGTSEAHEFTSASCSSSPATAT